MKRFLIFFAVLSVGIHLVGQDGFFVANPQGVFYFGSGKNNVPVLELPYINYFARSSDGRVYYAALGRIPGRKGKGGAAAVIDVVEGKFKVRNIISLQGRTPAHITLSPDGKYLYTANYSNGDIAEIALQGGDVRFIKHSGKSIHKRQKSPHPHQCLFNPVGDELYDCDLGTDEIFVYDYSAASGIKTPVKEKIKLPPGSGPRHLTFAPGGNTLYCANELSSTVTAFVRKNNTWHMLKTVSTLKEPFAGNYPGAIKISNCGKFVLVSNRGHNSIALFEASGSEDLVLLETVKVRGDFPYDILLLDNDQKVAVCNYKSGTLEIFNFSKAEKKLLPAAEYSVKQAKALID